MPNHIVNVVEFEGDASVVEDALRTIAGEKSAIDFDKLLPMPKELHGTLSPMPRHADADTQEVYADRARRFGASEWYEWCCEVWGTKWNAYETTREGNKLCFQTAWACPLPVLHAISTRWPTLTLRVRFADEDFGSNCGAFVLRHGVRENVPPFLVSGSPEAHRFAYELHGLGADEIAEIEAEQNE